jgi:hypothetical protein
MNPKNMILSLHKKGAPRSSLHLHPAQDAHHLHGRVGTPDRKNYPGAE